MNRFMITCLSAAVLVSWVGAEGPTGPAPAEQAQLFQRNREMIQELVNGGLDLAGETSSLKRAERCNRLARTLADEVAEASRDREAGRVLELAEHLRDLMDHGVAANLAQARTTIKPGSQDEETLTRLRDQARRLLEPADALLPLAGPTARQPELQRSLTALRESQERLDAIIRRSDD